MYVRVHRVRVYVHMHVHVVSMLKIHIHVTDNTSKASVYAWADSWI